MKKLSIICALFMLFGVSLAQAQQYEVAPTGTKAFTTTIGVVPNGTANLDIWITGVTGGAAQNAGGVWIDCSGSTADITISSAGRAFIDGSEGVVGLWTNGAGANVPNAGGPGTHMLQVAQLGGAPVDGDGDILVGTVALTNPGAGSADANCNFITIPSVATWTPMLDTSVSTSNPLVIEEQCDCVSDDECADDGLFCTGPAVCSDCVCLYGTVPPCVDDGDPCTLDCDEGGAACNAGDVCDADEALAGGPTGDCCLDGSPCASTGPDPQPICAAQFTLTKQSGYYQPPGDCVEEVVTIKNKICLNNPGVLVGGIQFDICDSPDCLTCINCELTERTVMFDCAVLELPNGCCRVVMFCKNPGCAINPGECDIVTVVMQTQCNEGCGEDCIVEEITSIVASDYDGYELAGSGIAGTLCPVVCGDVCPPGSGSGNDCGDGVVDIYDIMCEVDFALTATTPNECQAPRADVPTGTPPDCNAPDGEINILDVMVLIDSALNRQDCCSFWYNGIIY